MISPVTVSLFNHKPTVTSRGTGTYTCPAGKYARITCNVSGYAYPIASGAASGTVIFWCSTSQNFFESVEVWVMAGDTISFSASNASASDSSIPAYTVESLSARTDVTILHNGNTIAQFYADATIVLSNNTAGAYTGTRTIDGGSSNYWYAEEYNV